jgi:penicillin-binding protein 1A
MFLTPEKTLKRKLREAGLAIKIEKNLDKREILELYLNKIYFGHGAYGVEMASRIYFGKPVKDITLSEAALIAGLIKAPTLYSPFNDLTRAKERQRIVLSRMEEEGYIKRSEKENALKQPVTLSSMRKGMEANNYFIDYVKKYLEDRYGIEKVYKGDLRTTHRRAQALARAVQEGLRELDKRRGWRGPVEHKKDIDIEKELKTKELTSVVVTNPGDISTGLVLKVTLKEAIIKTRGIIGTLSIENAKWAAKVIDPKNRTSHVLKDFTLSRILNPGDIIKVSIKNIRGSNVQLALEQEPEVEGALVTGTGYWIHGAMLGDMISRSDLTELHMQSASRARHQADYIRCRTDHGLLPRVSSSTNR